MTTTEAKDKEDLDIPGYKISGPLGKGGMASVYLATQIGLERSVAVKILAQDAISDANTGERFIRETRTLAQFNHPNIVAIYDAGKTNEDDYYLSMECLDGGILTDRIKEGLSPKQALKVIRDIAQALAVAHKKGIIHRDIKPDNIMFRSSTGDSAVLTDFGIARDMDAAANSRLTTVNTIIGTPSYMSPEQLTPRKLDGRTDIFSLGVVLYNCLTQHLPYRSTTFEELLDSHQSVKTPTLPGKFFALQPLINKMLAIDFNDRLQTAEELIAEIDKIDLDNPATVDPKDKTVTMMRTPDGNSIAPNNKRKRLIAISAGLVIAIAATLAAISLLEQAPVTTPDQTNTNTAGAAETTATTATQTTPKSDTEQEQTVTTTDTDSETKEIESPTIYALNEALQLNPANTDIQAFKNGAAITDTRSLEPGDYTVTLSAPGYVSQQSNLTLPSSQQDIQLALNNNLEVDEFYRYQAALSGKLPPGQFTKSHPQSPFAPLLTNNVDSTALLARAESGDPVAQFQLSEWVVTGKTQQFSTTDAINWSRASANGGYDLGKLQLADLLLRDGREDSNDSAIALLQELSGKNFFLAINLLADAYLKGNGVKKDIDTGIALLKQSASLGDYDANRRLAKIYSDGRWVTRDSELANRYKRNAISGID